MKPSNAERVLRETYQGLLEHRTRLARDDLERIKTQRAIDFVRWGYRRLLGADPPTVGTDGETSETRERAE